MECISSETVIEYICCRIQLSRSVAISTRFFSVDNEFVSMLSSHFIALWLDGSHSFFGSSFSIDRMSFETTSHSIHIGIECLRPHFSTQFEHKYLTVYQNKNIIDILVKMKQIEHSGRTFQSRNVPFGDNRVETRTFILQ